LIGHELSAAIEKKNLRNSLNRGACQVPPTPSIAEVFLFGLAKRRHQCTFPLPSSSFSAGIPAGPTEAANRLRRPRNAQTRRTAEAPGAASVLARRAGITERMEKQVLYQNAIINKKRLGFRLLFENLPVIRCLRRYARQTEKNAAVSPFQGDARRFCAASFRARGSCRRPHKHEEVSPAWGALLKSKKSLQIKRSSRRMDVHESVKR
jgi:hypothetical protein